MNQEPKPEKKTFHINLKGERVEATPDNTYGFLHDEEHMHLDHVFYVTEFIDNEASGVYIWRANAKSSVEFDKIVYFMIQNGYDVENVDKPYKADVDAYKEEFEPPELPELGNTLKMRTRNDIAFMEYLVNRGKL